MEIHLVPKEAPISRWTPPQIPFCPISRSLIEELVGIRSIMLTMAPCSILDLLGSPQDLLLWRRLWCLGKMPMQSLEISREEHLHPCIVQATAITCSLPNRLLIVISLWTKIQSGEMSMLSRLSLAWNHPETLYHGWIYTNKYHRISKIRKMVAIPNRSMATRHQETSLVHRTLRNGQINNSLLKIN